MICVTYDVWVFTYDRNVSFDILGPICWSQEQPQARPNNALQVQLQGRLPTCITYHAFSAGAHKTWPLGLTFVAILGELSESQVRPVGFVLTPAAVPPDRSGQASRAKTS